MATVEFSDILNQLEERTEDCSLEEEQKLVRKAYNKMWRRILELSRESFYSYDYRNIYAIFMPEVEELRIRGRDSNLGTSLVTCPKKRPHRFFYPSHEMCLDDFVWEIFHNQMRSKDPEKLTTVLLMCVEFVNGDRICRVEENDDNGHAEENALRLLKTSQIKNIEMYISRSPCREICLPKIKSFIKNQHMMKRFRIRFSSVHAHYDSEEMKLLRQLQADIDVFSEDDWDHLETHLTEDAYIKLRTEFEEMSEDQREGLEEDNIETTSIEQSDDNNENDSDTSYYSENDDSGTDFDDDNKNETDNENELQTEDENDDSGTDFDDDKNETDNENELQAEDENLRDEIFLKRKFENKNDSDDIYIKRYKTIGPIKYEDDDD